MKPYSLYFFRGHRIARVEVISARDDEHALRVAATHPDAAPNEVWEKGRRLRGYGRQG